MHLSGTPLSSNPPLLCSSPPHPLSSSPPPLLLSSSPPHPLSSSPPPLLLCSSPPLLSPLLSPLQALSVLDGSSDGNACFHADLHMGNMLYCADSGASRRLGLVTTLSLPLSLLVARSLAPSPVRAPVVAAEPRVTLRQKCAAPPLSLSPHELTRAVSALLLPLSLTPAPIPPSASDLTASIF